MAVVCKDQNTALIQAS